MSLKEKVMNRVEFKQFCGNLFINYGFKKSKNKYYLYGKDLLCSIEFQQSYSDAIYINYYFYLDVNNDDIYPTHYDSDVSKRMVVMSKDTYRGEHFMDACIEYERYQFDEIKPYIDKEFEEHIMPIIINGKNRLKEDLDYYVFAMFEEEAEKLLIKLGFPNIQEKMREYNDKGYWEE